MSNLNPAQTDCTCTVSAQRSKIKNVVFVNKLTNSTENSEFLSVHRGRECNLCTIKTLGHDRDARVRVLPSGSQVRPRF